MNIVELCLFIPVSTVWQCNSETGTVFGLFLIRVYGPVLLMQVSYCVNIKLSKATGRIRCENVISKQESVGNQRQVLQLPCTLLRRKQLFCQKQHYNLKIIEIISHS